jgi:hypothetical protein
MHASQGREVTCCVRYCHAGAWRDEHQEAGQHPCGRHPGVVAFVELEMLAIIVAERRRASQRLCISEDVCVWLWSFKLPVVASNHGGRG